MRVLFMGLHGKRLFCCLIMDRRGRDRCSTYWYPGRLALCCGVVLEVGDYVCVDWVWWMGEFSCGCFTHHTHHINNTKLCAALYGS